MPDGWAWCRIKEIVLINPRNKLDDNLEVAFIPMSYIEADYKNTHNQEVKQWKEIKTGFTHFAENDVAIAKISPCFENRKSVILHNLKNGFGAGTTELFILRTSSIIIPDYLLWIVKTDSFINAGVGNFSGVVGQQRLAKDVVENYLIPLPPIEEQNRIASSIRTAFKHIDFIDKNSSDLLSSIKQTKSKILDLAIHGKLVPQDPNDEPAEELLKRIATSDNRPYKKLDENNESFTLPSSWSWCYLEDICVVSSAKRVLQQDWKERGIPFYRAREIAQLANGEKVKDDVFISQELYEELKQKYGIPRTGDLMVSAVGTIGKIYIVKQDDCFYYKDASVICFSKKNSDIDSKYLRFLFESSFLQKQIYSESKGTTVDTITISKAEKYFMPLPPIQEQNRIVSKIEELYSQLDSIASNIE